MRPGSPADLPELIGLWRREVSAGRQDMLPNEHTLRRILARFDWEGRSRVLEREGRIDGSVLVMGRQLPDGVLASVYAAGDAEVFIPLVRWGLDLSRASGAAVAQVFVGQGQGDRLRGLGLKLARPWWRMDRGFDGIPDAHPVPGYELADARTVPAGTWEGMFARTFADHWRFAPRREVEIVGDKAPELCLMAVTGDGQAPAGIAIGEVEDYGDDPRPQPVGLVSSVGTVPEHRRRGIATWLVLEVLGRLRRAGARSVSLYVDGHSPVKAYDVYRKIGFEVASEAEVWEATFP